MLILYYSQILRGGSGEKFRFGYFVLIWVRVQTDKKQEILKQSCNTHKNIYTGCPNKKETGKNMPVSLTLDMHLNIFGHYLLEGYLLFPTVPRNVGSAMSVNEHEHFKDRLTI